MSELISAELRESLRDPKDIGAYALLIERLGQRVGDVHPRLADPSKRRTTGDINAAELTYGEIVMREATDESPQLPAGARPYEGDAGSRLALARNHLDRIERQLDDGRTHQHPRMLAGTPVVELEDMTNSYNWLHPKVEGYDWYRGLRISTGDESAVIIFEPWMQPWHEGGAPFPALYAIGEPDPQRVREVVDAYCAA